MNYDPSLLTQSQDTVALEMAAYDQEDPSYMSKEDFGIITTTQEGILNTMQVMSNEIANHTDVILKKIQKGILDILEVMTSEISTHTDLILKKIQEIQQKKGGMTTVYKCYTCGEEGHFSPKCPHKEEYQKKKKTNSAEEIKPKFTCFTCGEPGHYSTNCPEKENVKPAPTKSNECFNCGEEGHWANKCPHEKQKKKTAAQKRSACYTCGETGHWTKDCPKIEEVIQTSDIEDNEPPKKIKKERKKPTKKPKKEDWDEEMKIEQKIPGRMKRINNQNMFIEEPDLD